MPHQPAIDGLRALAVVAVMIYHAEAPWLPGGFLGVEVFFVVSGYLITALLLAEHDRTGRIALGAFWARRARRLLPALGVFLAGSYAMARLLAPDVVGAWEHGIWAAALYVYNWYGIAQDLSYTETFGRPSFLHHLWSLAVEEQFYIVWPLGLWAGLRFLGRRPTLALVIAGAVGSTALMWHLYEPYADPLRIYYGTDTRAAGLLIGAALALVWRPWEHPTHDPAIRRHRAIVGTLASAIGLAGVIRAFVVYDLSPLEADALFRGGFALTSLSTALLIAGLTLDAGPAPRLLGLGPLQWIGTRSYGLYLWHWPVYMVTRDRVDVSLGEPARTMVRVLATVLVTEASYRLVEQPIRRRSVPSVRVAPRTVRVGVGLVGSAAMLALCIGGLGAVQDRYSADRVQLSASPLAPDDVDGAAGADRDPSGPVVGADVAPEVADPSPLAAPTSPPTPTPTPRPAPATLVTGGDPPIPTPAIPTVVPVAAPAATATPSPTPTPTPVPIARIVMIGDSVMEGAAPALGGLAEVVDLHTKVGRQWWELDGVVDDIGPRRLGDVVVIHLGNNGPVDDDLFDHAMTLLAGVDRVIFVNVRVPLRWERDVNAVLRRGLERYDNVELVDWYSSSDEHPEFFVSDGVHLEVAGQRAYARAIRLVLER